MPNEKLSDEAQASLIETLDAAPGGPEATAYTSQWMADAIAGVPKRWKAWPLKVQGRLRERDGRPLIEVWRRSDGMNLSDALLL